MKRSTRVAVVLSWAVYAGVGLLLCRRALDSPGPDEGHVIVILLLGGIILGLMHACVAERDRAS